MITRVINGVKCRMIEAGERKLAGDVYYDGSKIHGNSCIAGMIETKTDPNDHFRCYRPIKRSTKPKPKSKASGIEAMVCADIAERQKKGIAKYKMTVIDNPGDLKYFMNHFYEELLDAAVYAKRAMRDLDKIIANMEAKGN